MSSDNVTLSVIIPCFNDGNFLLEAIESTERFRGEGLEVIVVNDGSSDPGTLEILAGLAQKKVRVLHQKNLGLGAARNRGIALARGRYLLPLDADNRVKPEYIERGIQILDQQPTIDVVYGDAEYFGEKSGRNHVSDFDLGRLLGWNYIDACAVFRKSAWERCGGYDEKMPHQGFEDWDLWCRIACSGGGFYHVDEVLYEYRVRKDSMSSQMSTAERVAAVMAHMQAKKIEITMGDYLRAYQSRSFVIAGLRARPVRALISLLLKAFLPNVASRLESRLNARRAP